MATTYRSIDADILARLASIVGERNLIAGDPERLEAYSHDETAEKNYAHLPEAVVKPATTAEVQAIMVLANQAATARLPVARAAWRASK